MTINWNKNYPNENEVAAIFTYDNIKYHLYAGIEDNFLYYKGFRFIKGNPNEIKETIFLNTLKKQNVNLDDFLNIVLSVFCKYINLPIALFENNLTYTQIMQNGTASKVNKRKNYTKRKTSGVNNGR